MDLLSTIKNSNMEHFFPKGWDLKKIDECCSHKPEEIFNRQPFWHKDFRPVDRGLSAGTQHGAVSADSDGYRATSP
jgi:hypothetical protein